MSLQVYSTSKSFQKHLNRTIEVPFGFHSVMAESEPDSNHIYLMHSSSLEFICLDWLREKSRKRHYIVGICSDRPDISEMLEYVEAGAMAYCNSYMQAANYQHMLRLLENGQSWFPPAMLAQTFKLAQQTIKGKDVDALLQILTDREKEVALAVAEGMSNRDIANRFEISERTVKTHLTNIFVKLDLKDRVALVLYLK